MDPPANQKTNNLYNQLDGMSSPDLEDFSKLDLMLGFLPNRHM